MKDLRSKFESLGFDLVELDKLVYVTAGDGIPLEPPDCPDGKCTKGCYSGCATCSPGCSGGGT
jgi:hypothetical protein